MNNSRFSEDGIAKSAQELRKEAINRLNVDLPSNPQCLKESHLIDEEIRIHPQSIGFWFASFLILMMVLMSNYFWESNGSLFLRVLISLACLGPALALLILLFVKPVEIRLVRDSRTLTVSTRIGRLFQKAKTHPFGELESIQSSFRVTGDNDPGIFLELLLKNGNRLVLKRGSPDWSPSAPLLDYSGCLEPKEIAALRQKIASFAGIKDRGFHR